LGHFLQHVDDWEGFFRCTVHAVLVRDRTTQKIIHALRGPFDSPFSWLQHPLLLPLVTTTAGEEKEEPEKEQPDAATASQQPEPAENEPPKPVKRPRPTKKEPKSAPATKRARRGETTTPISTRRRRAGSRV
jgi:hypothetical protein